MSDPYYIEKRPRKKIVIEEELCKCVFCGEFFDIEKRIEDGKPFDVKDYGYEPIVWYESKCGCHETED